MYSTDAASDIVRIIMHYMPYIVLAGILSLAYRVCLTLAVHYDAKAKTIKHNALYTAFTFFFPIITGIVYLCTRNSAQTTAPKLCTNCGVTIQPEFKNCPNCSSPFLVSYQIPDVQKVKSNAKVLLIVAICCFVGAYIVNTTYYSKMINEIVKKGYSYSQNGDFDDFEKYFEQFGQEGGDNSNSENSEEYDNFNNFGK